MPFRSLSPREPGGGSAMCRVASGGGGVGSVSASKASGSRSGAGRRVTYMAIRIGIATTMAMINIQRIRGPTRFAGIKKPKVN